MNPLPIVRITPNSDLRHLVAAMRQAAMRGNPIEYPPQEHTPAAVIAAVGLIADEVLAEGSTRILEVKMGGVPVLVTVVLSIDAEPGEEPCWHLSASLVCRVEGEPGRITDAFAQRIAAAFGTPDEGPPEGVFKNVRHFRGRYSPN